MHAVGVNLNIAYCPSDRQIPSMRAAMPRTSARLTRNWRSELGSGRWQWPLSAERSLPCSEVGPVDQSQG